MTKITNFLFLTTLSVAYAGGCDSSPCENGGTCYDIGESGYECICNSFAGKNCQIAPPSVKCESSEIKIDIDRSWLMDKVNSDNHRHIYMGQGQIDNEGCKAVISETDGSKLEVKLENNFRECGTKVTRSEDGNFVYKNTVFMSLQNAGIQTGLAAIVQWTCEYEDEYTISYDNGFNPTAPRDDRAKARGIIGDFDLSLRPFIKPVYTTENLMASYITPGSEKIFHVVPNDKKWISFQTAIGGEAQLRGAKTALKKCFISSSRSPFAQTEITELIQDGCPTRSGISQIYVNGQRDSAQFAANVYKFKENWMEESPFYFHCETQLCPEGEYCPVGCSQDKSAPVQTKKGEPLMVHVTSGPYFFQGSKALIERSNIRATLEDEDAEHSYGASEFMGDQSGRQNQTDSDDETVVKTEESTLPLVGAMAILTLLCILVVTGLITIYNKRSAKADQRKKRSANQVNLNFAHEGSLRATKVSDGYNTVVVNTNGRMIDLPGSRPAGHRINYV